MHGHADEYVDYFPPNENISQDLERDDVLFLLSFYRYLDKQCDNETTRLEKIAHGLTQFTGSTVRLDARQCESLAQKALENVVNNVGVAGLSLESSFETVTERLWLRKLGGKFGVPHPIWGPSCRHDGDLQIELLALASCERSINSLLLQMQEVEAEIAAAEPTTLTASIEKLRFISERWTEGSPLIMDVLGFTINQCIEKIELETGLEKSLC